MAVLSLMEPNILCVKEVDYLIAGQPKPVNYMLLIKL